MKRTPLMILVLIFLPIIHADMVDTSAQVLNSPPEASGASMNGGSDISLTEGINTTVLGTVTITDNNGCLEILGVNATFYRETVGASGGDDPNDHYSVICVSNGQCSGAGDLTDTYNCTFEIAYYADPTDVGSVYDAEIWYFRALPYDVTHGMPDNDTVEINTLTALSIGPTSIDFGSMQLGADTGGVNQMMTVNNTGNEGIDVSVDGYGTIDGDGLAMNCTSGNVSIEYVEYDPSAFVYGAGAQLSDAASTVDLDIAQRTGGDSTETMFWGMGMPASGAGGTCTGNIQVLAVSDPNLL